VVLSDSLQGAVPSPDAALLKARFGSAFQEALSTAVAELSAQQRNVLRMHVGGGCSIDEIGRAYGVHRATAARWIERARTGIYERVRAQLGTQHRVTESEFRSLAGLMRAELELSLTRGSSSAHVIERPAEESG
jgi:RNA polymerase sigma-70 factor (ECF subfamily)